MAKKKRNRIRHDYDKYTFRYNGAGLPSDDERYYGIHRENGRIKIDIRRMKKIKESGVPRWILDAASQIPRNTVYFLPEKQHCKDYAVNLFLDKLEELSHSWREFQAAFQKGILLSAELSSNVRTEHLNMEISDMEDAQTEGLMAEIKRSSVYQKLWVSQCAQFIHQMATELDALMLRQCVKLGFAEKEVPRGKIHTYLNGTVKGTVQVENLDAYDRYNQFFTVWNILKHNSEDLFEKIRKNYPEMLLSRTYHNGELSQYYLKISDGYIDSMLNDLKVFYISFCREMTGEDTDMARWNYDDYFIETVKNTIERNSNPLGL